MEEFKLYSVSDDYVEWLRKEFPNVYSNKINSRTHTRKYLGVVLQIGKYHYYVPMSSPKDSDYQIARTNKVIKKSIVPIIRIVVKNKDGKTELKGTLRISHMIPEVRSYGCIFVGKNKISIQFVKHSLCKLFYVRNKKNDHLYFV